MWLRYPSAIITLQTIYAVYAIYATYAMHTIQVIHAIPAIYVMIANGRIVIIFNGKSV